VTPIQAVIFDLGGVVFQSPVGALAAFEDDAGMPPGTVADVIEYAAGDGVWARYERGEITEESFLRALGHTFVDAGYPIEPADLMSVIDGAVRLRPEMVAVIGRIRAAGFETAALTNNWRPFGDHPIKEHFDVFLESVVEGTRKPEREFYLRCLDRLAVPPSAAVFLDDLGVNLVPAADLGMRTIKVVDIAEAITELGELLNMDLAFGISVS